MALLDDILRGDVLTGVGIGLGTMLLAPLASQVLRPVAKEAIKSGMLAYKGLAEFSETVADVVAEAQAELAPYQAAGHEPPASPTLKRRRQTAKP